MWEEARGWGELAEVQLVLGGDVDGGFVHGHAQVEDVFIARIVAEDGEAAGAVEDEEVGVVDEAEGGVVGDAGGAEGGA